MVGGDTLAISPCHDLALPSAPEATLPVLERRGRRPDLGVETTAHRQDLPRGPRSSGARGRSRRCSAGVIPTATTSLPPPVPVVESRGREGGGGGIIIGIFPRPRPVWSRRERSRRAAGHQPPPRPGPPTRPRSPAHASGPRESRPWSGIVGEGGGGSSWGSPPGAGGSRAGGGRGSGRLVDGPPGTMWQSWFVGCSRCNQVRDLGTRRSIQEAVTAALENGWNTNSEAGWVCPEHFVHVPSTKGS